MTKSEKWPRTLHEDLLEMVDDLLRAGVITPEAHEQMTVRDLGRVSIPDVAPLSGGDIRAMREQANLSQALFARFLHLTPGYVSQLERGVKQPSGPALVLLDVIRRKGISALQ